MTRPAQQQRRRLRICMHAVVVSLAIALTAATIAQLALGVTAPVHGTTHASGSSHHGKCARHARRHKRRHRRCSARRRDGAKAPTPALALTAPAGPTLQPLAPIALAPPASAPPAPAGSAPASEGAKPGGEGDGEAGEGVEPPSIPHVQVSAVEYAFTLSRTTVPAGKVIFQFVNNGQDEHNLKIAPSEGPLAGSFANTPSKGIGDLQLEIQPGVYTLLCSLPTHEQKGMKATLTVE
jgi:plastocyanin